MMLDTPLPRLLLPDSSSSSTPKPLVFERELHPINVSVNLNIIPLSTVTMEVPIEETVPIRSWVEFFTPMGSAGIYRLRSPEYGYGEVSSTMEFEHAITEVADYLVRTKYEAEDVYASTAMQTIFSYYNGGRWQLGSLSLLSNTKVTVSETYSTVLNAMNAVLEQMPNIYMTFDFTTTPWTINFAEREEDVSAEGRLSRNVKSATVTYDDSELCTRLFMQGLPKPASDTDEDHYGFIEASTLSTYGAIEKSLEGSDGYTEAQALKIANVYLDKHKHPKVSISINAEALSLITGESWDTFTIGKKMRLVVDDRIVEENITELAWDDVYFQPEVITVYLAEEEDTVVNYLTNKNSTNPGSGGGGGGGSKPQKTKYIVQVYGMGQVTVYATSVQAAINATVSSSYTGYVTVNGTQYYVVNRIIQHDPNEDPDEDADPNEQ